MLPDPVAGGRRPVRGQHRRHLGAGVAQRLLPAPTRPALSNQSGGPETCQTVRCPALEQVAGGQGGAGLLVDGDARAVGRCGSPSMVTSGHVGWIRWSSASAADATGAMTTMPATRWSRCRSTTALIDAPVQAVGTLPTLTAKPAAAAARSNAVSSEAGPKRLRVQRDDAEQLAAPGDQRPGRPVGPVAQLGDRRPHPPRGLVPDVRVVVEHARHRLVGHPGQPGDVDHRRLARTAAGGHAVARSDGREVAPSHISQSGPRVGDRAAIRARRRPGELSALTQCEPSQPRGQESCPGTVMKNRLSSARPGEGSGPGLTSSMFTLTICGHRSESPRHTGDQPPARHRRRGAGFLTTRTSSMKTSLIARVAAAAATALLTVGPRRLRLGLARRAPPPRRAARPPTP